MEKEATNTLYLNDNRRSEANKQQWDHIYCYLPGSNKHVFSKEAWKKQWFHIIPFSKICYRLMQSSKKNSLILNYVKIIMQAKVN